MFAGYSGLEMGVMQVLDAQPAWFAEIDQAPARILQHHYPQVPNLGDVTRVDWEEVRDSQPIDILTAGYPCQPFSQAGHRKGTNDERHLWPYVLNAIKHLRPRAAFFENVRGHLTLGLPEGWVTGVPGLTRNQKLKALGNGVVPQQAAYALQHLLTT